MDAVPLTLLDASRAAPRTRLDYSPEPVEMVPEMAAPLTSLGASRAAPLTRIDFVRNEPQTDDNFDDVDRAAAPPTGLDYRPVVVIEATPLTTPPTRYRIAADLVTNELPTDSTWPTTGVFEDDVSEALHTGPCDITHEVAPPTCPDLVKNDPQTGSSCPTDNGSPVIRRSYMAPTRLEQRKENTRCERLMYFYERIRGLLDILLVFVFGIVLYIIDVSSDIMAGIHHVRAGHPVWGSLTITFVVLSALCWAAVSWTWWYCDPKAVRPGATKEKKDMRRARMRLAILLLDPLVT